MKYFLIILIILTIQSGCSSLNFPGVHRITIQQGNIVSQQMIDKLKPGMTKSQVRFILGNPIVDDALDKNRWDYIQTIKVAGGEMSSSRLILYFREDRLSYFEGDYMPTEFEEETQPEDDSG